MENNQPDDPYPPSNVALPGRHGRVIARGSVRHNMPERLLPIQPGMSSGYSVHPPAMHPNGWYNHYYHYGPPLPMPDISRRSSPVNQPPTHQHPTVNRETVDPRRYYKDPKIPVSNSHSGARLHLEEHYGGFCQDIAVIVAIGTFKIGGNNVHENDKVKAFRYQCVRKTCPWKAQIRVSAPSQQQFQDGEDAYSAFIKPDSCHNHVLTKEPSHHTDRQGLDPFLRHRIFEYVKDHAERRLSVLTIQPLSVTKYLHRIIYTECPAYKFLIDTLPKKDRIQVQVADHIQGMKKAYIKKILGDEQLVNNDTLSRLIAKFRLHIPPGYRPRCDYDSPDQLAEALKVPGPETGQMYLFSLTEGVLVDRYKSVCVGEKEQQKEAFAKRTNCTFFAMSIVGLWQLMNFANRRPGTRQLCVDGTGGTCQDFTPTVVLGALSQKLRRNKVTSSFRPLCYLKAGESIHPFLLTLYHLHVLGHKLFAKRVLTDVVTSDNCDSFQTGGIFFYYNPYLLNKADMTKAKVIQKPIPLKLPKKKMKIAEYLTPMIPREAFVKEDGKKLGIESVAKKPAKNPVADADELPDLPIVSQYTQEDDWANDDFVSAFDDAKEEATPAPNVQVPSVFQQESKGSTLCLFHLRQHFVQNNSFVKKFVDKAFAGLMSIKLSQRKRRSSKSKPKPAEKRKVQQVACTGTSSNGNMIVTAYMQVLWIHHAKSVKERGALQFCVLCDWIIRGEVLAANHFYDVYLRPPYCNWNYTCTEEQYSYASNCPIESNNWHSVKGGTNPVARNVSPETYIVETLPQLLANDVHNGRDPCAMEYPKNCSRLMVAVTTCFRGDLDVRFFTNEATGEQYWMANLHGHIGVPITEERLQAYEEALKGNVQYFLPEDICPEMYCIAAARMVRSTKSLCRLTKKDNSIVGDCVDCWKFGGYDCPGASHLRSALDYFLSPLEDKRLVKGTARGKAARSLLRGQVYSMYYSGLSLVACKKREPIEYLKGDDDFIRSLDFPLVREALRYLKVETQPGVKAVDTLLEFWNDPAAYRMRQETKAEDDEISVSSFDVMAEMESEPNDPDNIALQSLFDDGDW